MGRGRTSDVYAIANNAVIKISHDDVPNAWAAFEASLTIAVRSEGIPAPEVLDLTEVDGRTAIVFERIVGPSLWQAMVDNPAAIESLTEELVAIHRQVLHAGVPEGVPDFADRLSRKIVAAGLPESEQAEALEITMALPAGAALLHGDLHPGNVLMGRDGPIVIDWFDAAIGHPVADITRSAILMQPALITAPVHLPNSTPELAAALHRRYVTGFESELRSAGDELGRWLSVIAAGRLAEGTNTNESELLSWWQCRTDPSAAQTALFT